MARTRRLGITLRQAAGVDVQTLSLDIGAEGSGRAAEIDVWLRSPRGSAVSDTPGFIVGVLADRRNPRSYGVVSRGTLQVGDSIEVRIEVEVLSSDGDEGRH